MPLEDYPFEVPGDTENDAHETGVSNNSGYFARIPVEVYMWLIVVGAVVALWALYFSLGPLKNIVKK